MSASVVQGPKTRVAAADFPPGLASRHRPPESRIRTGFFARPAGKSRWVPAKMSYTPYGEQTAGPGARFTFTGLAKENLGGATDSMLAATYRSYRPGLGRWNQRDPAGAVDGPNWFRYATNSPLAFGDSSGLFAELINFKGNLAPLAKSVIQDLDSYGDFAWVYWKLTQEIKDDFSLGGSCHPFEWIVNAADGFAFNTDGGKSGFNPETGRTTEKEAQWLYQIVTSGKQPNLAGGLTWSLTQSAATSVIYNGTWSVSKRFGYHFFNGAGLNLHNQSLRDFQRVTIVNEFADAVVLDAGKSGPLGVSLEEEAAFLWGLPR